MDAPLSPTDRAPADASPTAHSRPPSWFRGFIQGKTRIVLAWFFGVLLVLSARHYPSWPGVVLCFIGATVRYWASGYLRKDTRPAIGGPYSLVRNPLYLGTYLMAVGTALAIENYWLVVLISVLFAVIYHYIILDEEEKLRRIFGAPYETYRSMVPRFFPNLLPAISLAHWRTHMRRLESINPDPEASRYSPELAKKNKAYEAFATFAAMIGFVALVALAWKSFAK